MNKILMSIMILILSCSSSTVVADNAMKNSMSSADLSALINQYMNQVFATRVPTLQDYYFYEGPHSEDEYGMEIQACKTRWGNPRSLDDTAYALQLPIACSAWIGERDTNRTQSRSLYYESIRKQFKTFPLRYEIQSIQLTEHGYLVDVVVSTEHAVIVLNVYSLKLAISDPPLTIVAIKEVRRK